MRSRVLADVLMEPKITTTTPHALSADTNGDKNATNLGISSTGLLTASFISTLTLIYFMTSKGSPGPNQHSNNNRNNSSDTLNTFSFGLNTNERTTGRKQDSINTPKSTPLPGFGILGDHINGFLEILLDGLAIYVHHDNKWDCQRRLLCEGNQRATEYGIFHSILMYFTSLSVSFWLRDQKVSESMEAMRKGRQGQDCILNYPECPFST